MGLNVLRQTVEGDSLVPAATPALQGRNFDLIIPDGVFPAVRPDLQFKSILDSHDGPPEHDAGQGPRGQRPKPFASPGFIDFPDAVNQNESERQQKPPQKY